MKRVFFDILLIVSIFILPWWVTLIWAIIGLFVFINYYEFLASSIIIYILSTAREFSFINKSFFIYFLIIIFYLIVQYIRRHIILYKNETPFKS